MQKIVINKDKDIHIDIMSNGICTNHVFVVDKTGEIYGWGSNQYMQLGLFDYGEQTFCYRL